MKDVHKIRLTTSFIVFSTEAGILHGGESETTN